MSTDRLRALAAPVPWRTVAAAVPVVLVNAVAFAGQLAFLRAHLHWIPPGQVMVALALESVAVYLAWHAHLAQLANDSALRLRLAAYGFALVIGTMNYSHYAAPGWHPTFAAITVGLMSAASPWLWSIHSRRVSRDALMAAGLIEPHALRLGATRWAWHPWRSAKVMYAATWEGITDPAEALPLWRKAPAAGVSEPPAGGHQQPSVPPAVAPLALPQPEPAPVPPTVLKVTRAKVTAAKGTRGRRSRGAPMTAPEAEREFAPELALGACPSAREIKRRCHVGDENAARIWEHLDSIVKGRMAMAGNGNGAHS